MARRALIQQETPEIGVRPARTLDRAGLAQLISGLAERLTYRRVAEELGIPEVEARQWGSAANGEANPHQVWQVVSTINRLRFFDLLLQRGMAPVSYDISEPFTLTEEPIGFGEEPPLIPLVDRPARIAGLRVDFPLGLPASVLAANSKWIEFYARRGFDILTYKTVRTEPRDAHPWPNWVFLKDPPQLSPPFGEAVSGPTGYWPSDSSRISMANSFGVPSFSPKWWQEDVRRAREVIREGHQVFIVSVIASRRGSEAELIQDFEEAALAAKAAGADIIEANLSCPNVPGDPGELFEDPQRSAHLARALKEAIRPTPLFLKIGYLQEAALQEFVHSTKAFTDGYVAINTIPVEVKEDDGSDTFPDREKAGVSGWAIRARALEVITDLVRIRSNVRRDSSEDFAILGVGGITAPADVNHYLGLGIDAVETCTGAFLDPYLGMKARARDVSAVDRLRFELQSFGRFVADVVGHPTKPLRW